MNSRALGFGIILFLALILALVMGQWVVTDPALAIGSAGAIIGICVILALGRHLWLLIPFFYAFTGGMGVVPGNFAPRDLIVLGVIPILMAHWVIRRFPLRISFGAIEWAVLAQFVCIGQAFARNPAGLAIFGTDTIGARPYFEIAICLLAFVVISTQVVDARRCRIAVTACFIGFLLVAMLELATALVPAVAMAVGPFYATTFAANTLEKASIADQGRGRLMYLQGFIRPLFSWSLAFRSPLQLILSVGPLLTALLAVICALLSGFRSELIWITMMVIAATFVRRRGWEILAMAAVGLPMLVALILGQGQMFDLPVQAQRALSFLPGDWDVETTEDAENSAEWRFEMWREALTTDKYIHNQILGDGFGFSAAEMNYIESISNRTVSTVELQEYYLMTGSYHSGPVEAIRRVGYIGLGVLLIGMGIIARKSVRLMRRAMGGPYELPAFYVGLPFVILPWFFVLIIGSYAAAVSQMCFMGGLLRLLENSMDTYARKNIVSHDEEGSLAVSARQRPEVQVG